ncbi:DUF397 domain-containing protein [Streptomyces armeniacus]|uniref:DUF397 domain-containing protein n=1 Tax=Streptomyces armeniacus TaxID=83291 RepID=A0A345XW46_9ACTN|nr:DUF397 domain-containing protein [Streptomyces armeniacus]AXK35862.1 DUF397 domain-containing protein [Streptomyces armeniacus]
MSAEETTHGTADLAWFKSSYSGSNGGECIEVAACPETVHVRDSKDTSRPCLIAPPESWAAFVTYAAQHGVSH